MTTNKLNSLPVSYLLKWLLISILIALLAGGASAIFLLSLDWATRWREAHPLILIALPLAGLLMGLLYWHFGQDVEAGNNLIIKEIQQPERVIKFRMMPFILLTTVATHLFGGSAGREGTALQMAGALADQLTKPLKLSDIERTILLRAAISAGFGAVFGTPLAGAVFALEVISIGRTHYNAIWPCFAAAILADRVTLALGVTHTTYHVSAIPKISWGGFAVSIIAGIAFGLTAMLFARAGHWLGLFFKSRIAYAPVRPLAGGIIVALAVVILGTTKYLGLGIPLILAAFNNPALPWDFLLKIAFTIITLSAGFKGGEVTPLFCIGATLGSTLSRVLPLPTDLLTGMGFVAVFGGTANTPVASMLMAIELFGSEIGVYAGIACVVSYLCSGHLGIYKAQALVEAKIPSV